MSGSFKLDLKPLNAILANRGLEARGRVQQYIGNEVLRRSDKYVPLRYGPLKNTARTENGGEEVRYPQLYAANQYYNTATSRSYDPLRGSRWFERMKTAEGQQLLEDAARLAGGHS